jgi:PAS domain S-box-containing protein
MIRINPDASKVTESILQITEPIIRVLYIDDEPDLLEIGKRFLERTGTLVVTPLSSAEEGLQALKFQSFDAIVSDYQMPEMDGITFLKALRHRDDQTPFILFTGRGREEIAIEAYEQGADHYVQKGGGPSAQFIDLAHKIRSSVKKHRVEEMNRTLTKRLNFRSRINSALARNRDWDELLTDICDIAIQFKSINLCWAGFIDPEQSMIIPYIARSWDKQLPEIPRISLSDPEEGEGDDPCGDALIRGFPFACNDISQPPGDNLKWSKWAGALGYNSLCSVPLHLYGELIGALMFISNQCEIFDRDLIDTLTEMGVAISFALSSLEGESHCHGTDDAFPANKIHDQSPEKDHLIDQTTDGILLTDEEGMILLWNRSMERITGLSKAQALGMPLGAIIALLCEDNDPEEYQQIEQMLKTGSPQWSDRPREITLASPDGINRSIEIFRLVIKTICGFRIQIIVREISGSWKKNQTSQ